MRETDTSDVDPSHAKKFLRYQEALSKTVGKIKACTKFLDGRVAENYSGEFDIPFGFVFHHILTLRRFSSAIRD